MEILKKHFKLILGIAVLILFIAVFFFFHKSNDLENGNMKNWAESSSDRRISAVKILTGGEEYTDLMVGCLNKISVLPDAAHMKIKDASSLCYTGIKLKENI